MLCNHLSNNSLFGFADCYDWIMIINQSNIQFYFDIVSMYVVCVLSMLNRLQKKFIPIHYLWLCLKPIRSRFLTKLSQYLVKLTIYWTKWEANNPTSQKSSQTIRNLVNKNKLNNIMNKIIHVFLLYKKWKNTFMELKSVYHNEKFWD